MKFTLSLSTALFAIGSVSALTVVSPEARDLQAPIGHHCPAHTTTVQRCGDPTHAVRLLRAYSASGTDHFYTTNAVELVNAVTNLGYTDEGVTGYIFPQHEPSTVPLYRLYSPSAIDHFYTTSTSERDNAANNLGYTNEGITGYVYPNADCGGLPLYRLYSCEVTDHFYTMSAQERDRAAHDYEYKKEGITGYIFPF